MVTIGTGHPVYCHLRTNTLYIRIPGVAPVFLHFASFRPSTTFFRCHCVSSRSRRSSRRFFPSLALVSVFISKNLSESYRNNCLVDFLSSFCLFIHEAAKKTELLRGCARRCRNGVPSFFLDSVSLLCACFLSYTHILFF